jgi:ABC-type hemin transport system substrate-binding protein
VATFTTTAAVASQITTALTGYATQAFVTSQGYITNVITALGYTPENVANKKTSLADNSDTFYPSQKAVKTAVDAKQDTLQSGTNIKTINGNSVLGGGDLTISAGADILEIQVFS